ncbi:MAG: (2Fe-2S)-binding protein [Acidobacteria bacterium]|jgi:NADH-quinone oxidoreductase subunit G|nr:(2Fe-2S)-binding protein [Acidobacteriota bacterium]
MSTVTFTIDGRELTVPKGTTVLQAAIQNGIKIPYYCYHPGLGVDGNCRVCLVKVEKMPKLQVSCSVVAGDGMIVHTSTPEVLAARAGVFEFLLINHPLDCPVCDKGGECPLQDFSYAFGPKDSRMEFERRTFDGDGVKADVDFGPTLMLNRNRCIMCTRCARFMREIDGDPQIGVINRGYHSEIGTSRDEGVHSLLSGNLMDVCPVGAITTRDYRFKSRPWDNPNAVDTVCTLCEKGCNTTLWIKAKQEWAKGAQLIRTTPRLNPEVNGYWMCDLGRFGYHWVEGDQRLSQPLINQQPRPWTDALALAGEKLRSAGRDGLRFLVSAHASHEEMFLLGRIAQELLGDAAPQAISVSWTSSAKDQPADTKFRIPEVNAPNVAGARALGLVGAEAAPDLSALKALVESGRLKAVFVLDPGPAGNLGDLSWLAAARQSGTLTFLAVQGVVATDLSRAADVVLPGSAWPEKHAAFTNMTGQCQTTNTAIVPPGEARDDWQILSDLAIAMQVPLGYESLRQVRDAIVATVPDSPAFARLAELEYLKPQKASTWLESSNASERVKWDAMFLDLPPFKFERMFEAAPRANVIPLKPVP